ncbi:MAG: ExbD/TolR family protein [Bdellovibrionales bacterium]
MRFTQKSSRRSKGAAISTASLPDIIFMILFFFMVVAVIPAPRAKIDAEVIVLTGGEELKETKHYIHVYLGSYNGQLVAQIGYDTIIPLDGLTEALKKVKEDDPQKSIVVLRIDEETGMGYIRNEVEPSILKAGIKKVRYQLEDENI